MSFFNVKYLLNRNNRSTSLLGNTQHQSLLPVTKLGRIYSLVAGLFSTLLEIVGGFAS